MYQKARGSGATLRTLEITKSVKATVYTELFYTAKAKARQELNRSRKVVNMQGCLHGKDEGKTKYSASRTTLITWTTHPRNKQGNQAEEVSTKYLHSKKNITTLL